jgi:prepilin signal peptidase PulO-like enzyme (type II secretory pathway)
MALSPFFVPVSFLLGLIVGSFANVLILRYGTGRGMGGRSSCPSCGRALRWFELIPVASFLFQRERCRACGGRISPQYVIVELVFGFLFALSALYTMGFVHFGAGYEFLLAGWASSFLLVSIAVYDLKHFIIPDGMAYAFMVVAFAWGWFYQGWGLRSWCSGRSRGAGGWGLAT